jgi:WD40 repeat protein
MYLDFTPDGDVLATDHDDAVVFWDVRAGRERGSLALPIGGSVCALAFSPDGELIAVGDGHGVIRLWPWRRLLSAGR